MAEVNAKTTAAKGAAAGDRRYLLGLWSRAVVAPPDGDRWESA